MYTCPLASNMAKLYWRIKKEGKWTWVAATAENSNFFVDETDVEDASYIDDNPIIIPEE